MLTFLSLLETPEEKLRFEELYRKYRKPMFGLALSVLDSENDAADAVNNAFVAAAENFAKLKDLTGPQQRSFLMTAAKYKAIDIYRQRKKIVYIDSYSEDLKEEEAPEDPRTDALYRAMKKLPPLYRDLLVLKLDQELSTAKIAEITSRKPDTVRKELQRAKKKLKELISEDDHET